MSKFYFNSPYVIKRIGAKRTKVLSRTGAYGRGVFRNKLGRPQRKQTQERTILVDQVFFLPNPHTGVPEPRRWTGMVFVPRKGAIRVVKDGRVAPTEVARYALTQVAKRIKGMGGGKPPRAGPSRNLRRHNEFYLDSRTDSVVIGTVPFPKTPMVHAASLGHQLDQGALGLVEHPLLPGGSVTTVFTRHPYVQSVLPPTLNKMGQLIESVRL